MPIEGVKISLSIETRGIFCNLCSALRTSQSLRLREPINPPILHPISFSPYCPSFLLPRTDGRLSTGWFPQSMGAEENLLGASQSPRERHHGPLAFVPSGTYSAQVLEAFSALTHQTTRTRTTGQVTIKLLCTHQHGASPDHPHGTPRHRRRGTWHAADRPRYTQRKSQKTRQEKPYGTTI